jgi:hypothetical protein
MKHLLKSACGLILAVAVGGSAAAAVPCVPIPPKEWTGNVSTIHPGASFSTTFFEQNGCDWKGFDQLNGADGLIFDVEGSSGAANMTAVMQQTSIVNTPIGGYFLDASCKKIDGSDYHATGSAPSQVASYAVTIPEGAKWMEVNDSLGGFGNTMTVTLQSLGKDCPKPKKKKGKK